MTESANGADVFHSLTRATKHRENQASIGLPVPQMRTSGETWLPGNSYANVVDAFAEKFVSAFHQRGADGFYLAMEMPLTDGSHWVPVTNYYDRQTRIINAVEPGATVLISPYLEGRGDRETITPETAAAGYQKLLDLHNGTDILVSPQDGVGGGTALDADDSEAHAVTVEDYFATLHEVNPDQLDATDPFVQGAIGFQWSDPTAMTQIPHIGNGACAAGPEALP